jgi:hypothetical protein
MRRGSGDFFKFGIFRRFRKMRSGIGRFFLKILLKAARMDKAQNKTSGKSRSQNPKHGTGTASVCGAARATSINSAFSLFFGKGALESGDFF